MQSDFNARYAGILRECLTGQTTTPEETPAQNESMGPQRIEAPKEWKREIPSPERIAELWNDSEQLRRFMAEWLRAWFTWSSGELQEGDPCWIVTPDVPRPMAWDFCKSWDVLPGVRMYPWDKKDEAQKYAEKLREE